MKKSIAYIFAAIAVMAFASCQKFESETSQNTGRVLTVSFRTNKTTLDGAQPKWNNGDVIRLLDGEDYEDITISSLSAPSTSVELTTTLKGETIYAIYPVSAAVSEKVTGDVVEFTTARQDGTFPNANICVAKEDKGTLSFKNATAIVNVKNTNDPYYIKISSGSTFVGTMSYNFTTEQFTNPTEGETEYSQGDYYASKGTISGSDPTVLSEIFYAVPGGITYSFEARWYQIKDKQTPHEINQSRPYSPTNNALAATVGTIYTITPVFK